MVKLPEKIWPLKQIRKYCLSCCGGDSDEVKFCTAIDCKLWYLRFGRRPARLIKNKKFEFLLDKENFKDAGIFEPSRSVAENRKKLVSELS